MKKLIAILMIAVALFTGMGCSKNATDDNYQNTDPNNMEERIYEEEMDDASLTAEEGGTGYVSE